MGNLMVVETKMETIQNIFRDVQDNFPETYTLQNLPLHLDSYEVEFRSIAYEAASFCIALKDLEAGNELNNWKIFLQEIGKTHATQIYVGLGWALAQKQIDPSLCLSVLAPMMRYRVLDGYGYYEGTFRRRKSILSQQKPELKDEVTFSAYDQGLGRSLWYIYLGKIDDIKNIIQKFPVERRKDLWRGLGIATSYVGGCDKEMLKEILDKSGEYKTQLTTGSVMVLVSRDFAGFISDDTALACTSWCNKTSEEIINLYKPQLDSADENSYSNWIATIEKSI